MEAMVRATAANDTGDRAQGDTPARAARRAALANRIEVATLRLCLEHGVDGVTVDLVAANSGISRRTFYRYFDTISDVLCAMPRRSLDRFIADYKARPASEGAVDAFINVMGNTQLSDEELAVHALSSEVYRRNHAAWRRAMNSMSPSAHDVYSGQIADRLAAGGKDSSPAGLIAAVLQGVIDHVLKDNFNKGTGFPHPDRMKSAFRQMAAIINEQV